MLLKVKGFMWLPLMTTWLRDAEWMGQIYRWLGLEVACGPCNRDTEHKRQQYQADVTYGTNNELGFNYLRDNMTMAMDKKVREATITASLTRSTAFL